MQIVRDVATPLSAVIALIAVSVAWHNRVRLAEPEAARAELEDMAAIRARFAADEERVWVKRWLQECAGQTAEKAAAAKRAKVKIWQGRAARKASPITPAPAVAPIEEIAPARAA